MNILQGAGDRVVGKGNRHEKREREQGKHGSKPMEGTSNTVLQGHRGVSLEWPHEG